MSYSIIEVESKSGNKISGSYRSNGNHEEPKTLVEATKLAKHWEKHDCNIREYAVVKSVLKTNLYREKNIKYFDLVRLDKPRKKKTRKPISFKGKFRCVFTDPPKIAGQYNIVHLDKNNKVDFFSRKIRHDGKSWLMEVDNYVSESSNAYWLDMK